MLNQSETKSHKEEPNDVTGREADGDDQNVEF